jgi:hypothetical protein
MPDRIRSIPGIINRIGHSEDTTGIRVKPITIKTIPETKPTIPLLIELLRTETVDSCFLCTSFATDSAASIVSDPLFERSAPQIPQLREMSEFMVEQ